MYTINHLGSSSPLFACVQAADSLLFLKSVRCVEVHARGADAGSASLLFRVTASPVAGQVHPQAAITAFMAGSDRAAVHRRLVALPPADLPAACSRVEVTEVDGAGALRAPSPDSGAVSAPGLYSRLRAQPVRACLENGHVRQWSDDPGAMSSD